MDRIRRLISFESAPLDPQVNPHPINDDPEVQAEQFKKQCLDYLDTVLEQIKGFGDGVYILNDQHLAELNVRKAQPLDIDEHTVEVSPRFFAPRYTLEEARQKTDAFIAKCGHNMGGWPGICRRGSYTSWMDDPSVTYDPEEFHPLCTPHTDAESRLFWCLTVAGATRFHTSIHSVWHGSEWYYLDEVDLVPGRMFNLPQHFPGNSQVGSPLRSYAFHVSEVFLLNEPTDKRHIGGAVLDSSEAREGKVLRSEVAAAVGLLKHQFRRGDFSRHHTLPALVFSFQHDRLGRITQFHFNGRSLVMRQSRLLNFYSNKPTPDAYHMIRWMDNHPIGDTQFGEPQENSELINDHDINGGMLPINVRRV